MTSVAARRVTVERGGKRLLDDVSLQADAGQVVGIVGPNGAGKSTLLRVLAGDIGPHGGSSTIGGQAAGRIGLAELARLRSYVGPQTVSDISFTVGEVVLMGTYPASGNASDRAATTALCAAAMRRADVVHLSEREMRTLSSGEQQRVSLARAIAQQAPVMLLDEPTSALDLGHQDEVMKELRRIAADGVAIVVVLHDLNLAAAYTDYLLLLAGGRSLAMGRPPGVLTAPLLTKAYGRPVEVIDHPFRACPLVLMKD